ncbi:MAG: hemolysin family protein [Leptolyngbyaceae cyanobacterium bins.349]|nr:hemolysin family protein [Leptolyngbyaceae cyanobacterium bins.349]
MVVVAIEIALILLLITANGIFSGSEIAIVSVRKVRLEQLADQGNRKARVALRLASSPNDFLSTVQIGITLIGILSGAVGGATLAQRLKPVFDGFSGLQPYSEGISVAIVVTIITYLSLVVGELVPKRIALNEPEQIACAVARPMRFLSRLTAPLVHLLSLSTDALLKLLGVRASDEPEVTEEEIKVLIRQGAESGMFEEAEHEMVERVFRLGDRPIKALMTPRIDVVWLDVESPLEESLHEVMESNHSRFPVGRGSLDNCIGVVRGSSLLTTRLSGGDINLEAMVQPPLYVAETTRVLNVLGQFKEAGAHMALITDEYGGIEGVVTLNDLMEAIVGDLPSWEDQNEPMVIHREDGSWLVDGSLGLDEIKKLVDKDFLPGEETGNFHTLGGFVMHSLGRIPESGQHFEYDELRFEVVDMDGTRVDKVLVTARPREDFVILEENDSDD